MNKSDIQLLYNYNQWANSKIIEQASRLTQEQFLMGASYPHGGMRGTLTHILFAEWIWRRRWQGESPSTLILPEDFQTFDSLKARWLDEEHELMNFASSLTEDRLAGKFQYKTTKGEPRENVLWQVMMHVVNHGTQHRSEAAAMLTDMGFSPGDIDLIKFLRERV